MVCSGCGSSPAYTITALPSSSGTRLISEEEYQQAVQQATEWQEKYDAKDKEKSDLQNEYDKIKNENDKIKGENDSYKSENDSYKGQVGDLNGQIKDMEIEIGSYETQVKDLNTKISALQDEVNSYKEQLAPPPASTGHGRLNPAPIGMAQTLNVVNRSDEHTLTIKIINAISGAEAWNMIYAQNKFNDPAPDGKMYIMANIEATVNKVNSDKAISFSKFDFKLFSDTNVEYDNKSVVTPEPEFGEKVFEGGILTGNVVFLVDKSDPAPKIVYGMKFDGTGGIWFSLK